MKKRINKKKELELDHKIYLIIKYSVVDDTYTMQEIINTYLFKEKASYEYFKLMKDKFDKEGGRIESGIISIPTPPYEVKQEEDNNYNTLIELEIWEKNDLYRYGLYEYNLERDEYKKEW